MYIDQILDWLHLYSSSLSARSNVEPENQDQSYINEKDLTEKEAENKSTDSLIILTELINHFVDKFYFSVLSGEYITDENFDSKLHTISDNLGKVDSESNDQILINAKKQIRSLITNYRHYNKKIHSKYERPDKIELFSSFIDNDDSPWLYSGDELEIKCDVFKWLVLPLSELDHNLSVRADHDSFRNILIYLTRLSEIREIEGSPIKFLLESKCKILLFKLAKRVEQDDKKYYYTHNLSDKEFDINETIPMYFRAFIDDVELQYYDDIGKPDLKNRFTDYCKGNKDKIGHNSTLSLQEAHGLVKYFKDKNNSGENSLKSLVAEFKIPSEPDEHIFNKRAKKVGCHYLLNNYFSFLVFKDSSSHEDILDELNKIQDDQIQDDVENYFPYLRYCEYLIKLLENDIQNGENDNSHSENLVNKFDQFFKILMNKYEWCYDRNFLAFMPTFEECVKTENINDQDYKLFIASSFVLPINYAQVKRQIDELYQKYTKFKLISDVRNFQDKANSVLDLKIEKRTREFADIEDRVKESERKNIEILGIFAAIVLFTMSNIQIFSKIDYVKDAILFMLIMAYCMCMFIVVIWLITRDKGYFGKDDDYKAIINKTPTLHKVIIGLLIISTVTSLIYTAPYFNSIKSDSREKKFENIGLQIDTLKSNDLKTDSILRTKINTQITVKDSVKQK